MPEVTLRQEKIQVAGQEFMVTAIPPVSRSSYAIRDPDGVWVVVVIDEDGNIIRWYNEPTKYKADIEAAIKKTFADDFSVL